MKKSIVSLKQLKKELQTFTEKVLHEQFRWATVEGWILDILRDRVEDIVMCALGYEWDDNCHNLKGRWQLKDHGDKISIMKILEQMANVLVEQHLPGLIAEKAEAITAKVLSPSNRRNIGKRFEYEFDKILHAKINDWVNEHAAQQIEAIFETHGEEFLKEIKLKHRLTMDSLQLLSGDADE